MRREPLMNLAASLASALAICIGLPGCVSRSEWINRSDAAVEANKSAASYVRPEHLAQCEAKLNRKSLLPSFRPTSPWRFTGPLRREDSMACMEARSKTAFGSDLVYFAAPIEVAAGTSSEDAIKSVFHCVFSLKPDRSDVELQTSWIGTKVSIPVGHARASDEFANRCGYKMEEPTQQKGLIQQIREAMPEPKPAGSKPP